MNKDQVTHQQIDDWHWRVAALQQRTDTQQQYLGAEAFEELSIALAELQIAQEELQEQNEELESTRSLVEVERQRYEELFKSMGDSDRIPSTLISNLPGMAYRCLIDSKYTFEFVSVGCFDLTGYHPADFSINRKLTYDLLIHPEDRLRVRQEMEAALCGRRRFTIVYRIISAVGEEKWVWDRGLGIYATDGNLLAIEGFVTDITERKRSEELQQAQVEALVKLNQQKDDFLSTVSHELRTPVSNMKVAIQMLEVSLNKAGVFWEAEAREFTLPAELQTKSMKSDAEYRKISHYLQILKDKCEQEIILIDRLLDQQW